MTQSTSQKHLGLFLETKLDIHKRTKNIFNKVNKTIGLMHKPHLILSNSSLLTIYKFFIRPHLDYWDITYDQKYNALFLEKLESIQSNSALAIRGAIRGTSIWKLYYEPGLENLEKRRWHRKPLLFFFSS